MRVKSAISMALINSLKAKQVDVGRLLQTSPCSVKYFIGEHSKRLWTDEEYLRLYESFVEYLKTFDASVNRKEPCKYL